MTTAITIWRKKGIVYVTTAQDCCRLGPVGGALMWQLVEAADGPFPWLPGKQLLEHAGSRVPRPRDVFRRRPELWSLIRSNGDGDYSLAPGRLVDHDTYEIDGDWLTRRSA